MYELSDTYAQEDLDLFYANYAPYIPKGTHPIPAFINGATAPVSQDKAGGESNVDLEIVLSLIYPQTVTLYQTDDSVYFDEMGDRPFYGWFNNFLDALDGVSIIQKIFRWLLTNEKCLVLLHLLCLQPHRKQPRNRSHLSQSPPWWL